MELHILYYLFFWITFNFVNCFYWKMDDLKLIMQLFLLWATFLAFFLTDQYPIYLIFQYIVFLSITKYEFKEISCRQIFIFSKRTPDVGALMVLNISVLDTADRDHFSHQTRVTHRSFKPLHKRQPIYQLNDHNHLCLESTREVGTIWWQHNQSFFHCWVDF